MLSSHYIIKYQPIWELNPKLRSLSEAKRLKYAKPHLEKLNQLDYIGIESIKVSTATVEVARTLDIVWALSWCKQ